MGHFSWKNRLFIGDRRFLIEKIGSNRLSTFLYKSNISCISDIANSNISTLQEQVANLQTLLLNFSNISL